MNNLIKKTSDCDHRACVVQDRAGMQMNVIPRKGNELLRLQSLSGSRPHTAHLLQMNLIPHQRFECLRSQGLCAEMLRTYKTYNLMILNHFEYMQHKNFTQN
jgi:hypothetical protein